MIMNGTADLAPRGLDWTSPSSIVLIGKAGQSRINSGAHVVVSNVLPFLDKVCRDDYYSGDDYDIEG
jgi:hypothetical protein